MLAELIALQTLLTFEVSGSGPVRFGVPLPVERLERGLHVEGHPSPTLQWRLLQDLPGFGSDRVWVELAVDGVVGRARLVAGGEHACPTEGPFPVVRTVEREEGASRVLEHHWTSGSVDRLSIGPVSTGRVDGAVAGTGDGPVGSGRLGRAGAEHAEWSEEFLDRRTRVRISPRFFETASVLPRAHPRSRTLLRTCLDGSDRFDQLQAPAPHGRGDSIRFGTTVANGEFDRSLSCVLLGLRSGDPSWLVRAYESARHLVDVDLDRASGLPYRHGEAHRGRATELGHVWIRGLRLVALLFADRGLLQKARVMTRSLAERVRGRKVRQGPSDRMRDEAWPLWELEAALRFESTAPVEAACLRLVESIHSRWDPDLSVFRYGEGRTNAEGVVHQRIWQTCAILLPALRLARERGVWRGSAIVETRIEERFETLAKSGRDGIPLGLRVAPGREFAAYFGRGRAECCLAFDGLSRRRKRRLWSRVDATLESVLPITAEDFATRLVLVSRCGFVVGG